MSVMVLVELSVADGKLNELTTWLETALVDTRAREGFQAIDVYQDQDNPSTITFVEQFRTRADFEGYVGWRTERGDLDVLVSFLTGPPSIRYFDRMSL